MFKLFSASKVDEFAKQLARELAKRYPPVIANDRRRQVSALRLTKILEETFGEAQKFTDQQKLGVVKKARFGNTFRWELKELGYGAEFVQIATEGFIVYVTGANPTDKKTASSDETKKP